MTYWLLVRGRGDRPLDARIDPATISRHGSSRRPAVQRGDLAILYAAVWQALYGVVEVVGDLHDAPPVEAAGVFPQSLWRHSYIRLSVEQFEAARALVEGSARGA
jgi:hypothetical protein